MKTIPTMLAAAVFPAVAMVPAMADSIVPGASGPGPQLNYDTHECRVPLTITENSGLPNWDPQTESHADVDNCGVSVVTGATGTILGAWASSNGLYVGASPNKGLIARTGPGECSLMYQGYFYSGMEWAQFSRATNVGGAVDVDYSVYCAVTGPGKEIPTAYDVLMDAIKTMKTDDNDCKEARRPYRFMCHKKHHHNQPK